jgi:hypothetical protein
LRRDFELALNKKYIIPIIAFLAFAVGTAAMVLPFLPFGWFLYGFTALILIPYFPPIERIFLWIVEKDNTGLARKAGQKVAALYRWAGDFRNAREVEDISENGLEGEGEEVKEKPSKNH